MKRLPLIVTLLLLLGCRALSAPATVLPANLTVLGPGKWGSTPGTPLLRDSRGDLFGNTIYGGRWDDGTIYELPARIRHVRVLATFDGRDGARPNAGLVMDSHGDLFGTTWTGGPRAGSALIGAFGNDGVIFELPRTHNGYGPPLRLASFSLRTGDFVGGGLVIDGRGALFGEAGFGGRYGDGTVFELPAGARRIKVLVSFNGRNGFGPFGGSKLILDGKGNLLGSSGWGGHGYDGEHFSGNGVLFELPGGKHRLKVLAAFHGPDGIWPQKGIVTDAQGDLFGVASNGGIDGKGTVFEWSAARSRLMVLASFHGRDGAFPNAPLL